MNAKTSVPMLLAAVSAGRPVEVNSEFTHTDLNRHLTDGSDCLLINIYGDSMTGCGIEPGDCVILSRSRLPQSGDIVIAELCGKYVIKVLENTPKKGLRLVPANDKYKPHCVCEEDDCYILGVVIAHIRRF